MSGNAAIVRRGYDALNAGDSATLTELLGDDGSWHIPGRSPLAGDVVGREAVCARSGPI
jgi:ketosteroid isomerase-like protein